MNTAARKQRERAQREELILTEARKMVLRDGYLGLNMDRLADAVSYSKGTLYQHFSTKEDLMLGIVTQGKAVRESLFQRAANFEGRARERMAAVGVADRIFAEGYPEHFHTEHLLRLNSVWDKTSPERQEALKQAADGCHGACGAIIELAIRSGDLDMTPEQGRQMFFLLMTASLGTHLLAKDPVLLELLQIDADPYLAQRPNYDAYLDGCNWRPLSNEWDYGETYRRIENELYADELARLRSP